MSKRRNAGIKLLAEGKVMQIEEGKFIVRSKSRDYQVVWNREKWTCECPDFEKRGIKCKHIYAVMYYLAIQDIRNAVTALDGKSAYIVEETMRS